MICEQLLNRDLVKKDILKKAFELGIEEPNAYEVKAYRQQVVNGILYFVKVRLLFSQVVWNQAPKLLPSDPFI